MKGLYQYLTPFAPDQSGAAAVFYDLSAITVICDAGGCAGNICGFDIPDWKNRKSAIFSAGLRDMDAIMGRDRNLADKIACAASRIEAEFVAVIGTPVPAFIGTDYRALAKMIEKRARLPVICIDTNGMELYDRGEEKAYFELYKRFALEKLPAEGGRVNYIGEAACRRQRAEIKEASAAEKNIVISPSGFKAARLLKERFGTPYEAVYPGAESVLQGTDLDKKDVLIIHQQVFADTLRRESYRLGAANVTVATWFMMDDELRQEKDISLKEEDELEALCAEGFDVIIGDAAMRPIAGNFCGIWIDAPHFALSGRRQ